jgi:hypothetical protein
MENICKQAIKMAEELREAEQHKIIVNDDSIPREIGVYCFRDRKTDKIVYIGRAIGEKGLYQRIRNQHVNNKYLDKQNQKEKSVFRKKASNENELPIGDDCVKFICDNFTIAYLPCPEKPKQLIILTEKLLIIKEEPKYNNQF